VDVYLSATLMILDHMLIMVCIMSVKYNAQNVGHI